MTLGSAIIISAFIFLSLKSLGAALFGAFLFLCNPVSIYYSNTSNMDQPYVFWWLSSLFAIFVADKYAGWNKKNVFLAIQVVAGACFGLSFCTKDQVYALYLLPLSFYLFYLFKKNKSFKAPLLTLIAWIAAFTVTTTAIYAAIGGWKVFSTHIRWITNDEHQILFSQYGYGVLNRFKFVFKTFCDLFSCIDYPMIVIIILSITVLSLKHEHNKGETILLKKTFIFLALSLVSLEIFYVQIAHFSFPRYYLPMIPIVSCIGAFAYGLAYTKSKKFSILLILPLAAQFCVAAETISSIRNDTRITLRKMLTDIQDEANDSQLRIALTGVANVRKVVFGFDKDGKSVIRKTTLVNEPLSTFGYISERQKSLVRNHVSLFMFNPQIVVNVFGADDKWNNTLKNNGFDLISTISRRKQCIPTLFKHNCPDFDIYIYQNAQSHGRR